MGMSHNPMSTSTREATVNAICGILGQRHPGHRFMAADRPYDSATAGGIVWTVDPSPGEGRESLDLAPASR